MSKQHTRSEVANSNDKDKTLIIVHDKVYNVKSFLNEHPGGEEILLEHQGKDASEDFDDVGHSKEAFELMKKYQVGELIESERSNTTPKQNWGSPNDLKSDNQDQGMSSLVAVAFFVVLAALAYYVYF